MNETQPGATPLVHGLLERVPLSKLSLDRQNPRLPEQMQRGDIKEDQLLAYIDKAYEPIDIARSIARHGYFESEPLIGIKEGDQVTVVEGNRRLVALRGLSDERIRRVLNEQTRGWQSLPTVQELAGRLPGDFPVVMVQSRNEVAPLLGYRHISGIAPWEPFAQARYIFGLVEEDGLSFEQVAELVGRSLTEVRSMYRDHEILRQAESRFKLDVRRVQGNFGVFNRAMTTRNLRAYIDAPAPAEVSAEEWPLPEDSKPKVEQLITWIFGDKQGKGSVISDSRQLNTLGNVLANPRAQDVLSRTGNLEAAQDALGDPDESFRKHLNRAVEQLNEALRAAPKELSPDLKALVGAAYAAFKAIDELYVARRST
jgi:hypothetical protein